MKTLAPNHENGRLELASSTEWQRWLEGHSARVAVLWMVMSLNLLIGCVEGFDAFNQSDAAYYRLYDYTINRPRVMGIRYLPRVAQGGETINFEALAAAPLDAEVGELQWWGCGTALAEPFSYYQADCLNTSVAQYLGAGREIALTLPSYDASSCEYGCVGYLPIFAILTDKSSGEEGMAATWISPDYAGAYQDEIIVVDLDNADLRLIVGEGEGAEDTVRRGQQVPLRVEAKTYDVDFIFSWYVSAGKLLSYGVTRANSVDLNQEPRKNLVMTENILEVPIDYIESTLDIYVVVDPASYYYPGVERFLKGQVKVIADK